MRTSTLLFVTTLVATSLYIEAAQYDYSYTFRDGTRVYGSVWGTENGNLLTDLSYPTMFVNGQEFDVNYVQSYGENPDRILETGAQMSFDGTENNFLVVYGNWAKGEIYPQVYEFESITDGTRGYEHIMYLRYLPHEGPGALPKFEGITTSRWSLTATKVPDTGSTLALLGMTMSGIGWLRRKGV